MRAGGLLERGDLVRLKPEIVTAAGAAEGLDLDEALLARRAVEEKGWAYASDPAAGAQVGPSRRVRLQPYREWGNRGAGTMRVFMPMM